MKVFKQFKLFLFLLLAITSCSFTEPIIGGYNVREEYNKDLGLTFSEAIEKRGAASSETKVIEDGVDIRYLTYSFKGYKCKITYKFLDNMVSDIVYKDCPKKMGGIRLQGVSVGNPPR